MKKIFNIALLVIFLGLQMGVIAQPPPPPANPTDPSGNSPNSNKYVGQNQTDLGAPVGNGTLLLLVFALSYAGSKVYLQRKKDEEE